MKLSPFLNFDFDFFLHPIIYMFIRLVYNIYISIYNKKTFGIFYIARHQNKAICPTVNT